jgi:hypothetical protein
VSEIPKHGGGPQSFSDAARGLRKRKDKIRQRNKQINSLKGDFALAKAEVTRLKAELAFEREQYAKVMFDADRWRALAEKMAAGK